MKTVAITGSAGFIGSHLTDRLLADGYRVIGIDNLSMGSLRNFEHNLSHPRFTFHHLDVLDLPGLAAACQGIDVLIHLAAFKIPRYGKAIDTLLVNVKGSEHVLEVARAEGARLVMASTSDVYGKNPAVPFTEQSDSVFGSSTVSRWAYAASKLFDEHLAFAYADAHGLPVVVLRFFGCYGPRHHRSWWGGPQAVFIDAVLAGREIEIHGDGRQTRSFIYVDDLVDGIARAVESERVVGEVLNLGNTQEISILELAHLIARLSGAPAEPRLRFVEYSSFSERKYEDVRRRVPDISKAASLIGFACTVPLDEGLRRAIAWHRAQIAAQAEADRPMAADRTVSEGLA